MKRESIIKKIIFLIIFIFSVSLMNANGAVMSARDKKFFKAFTKKKRNINTVKLKYLKWFFRLIDLNEKDAVTVYNYKKKKGYIKDFKELLSLPGIDNIKIARLKKYFVIKKPVSKVEAADIDEIEAEIAAGSEESTENSEDFEVLQKYKDNPLDLNEATMENLEDFPWLTPVEAMRILKYRDKIGRFKSVNELEKVPGLDEDSYRKLLPFVRVVTAREKAKEEKAFPLHGKFTTRYLASYPLPEEYYTKYYQWPIGIKNKLTLNYGTHFDGGVMFKRDYGEVEWNDAQKFYFQVQNYWILKKIILGDFRIYSGQGLVFYPSSPMKGGEIVKSAKQKNKGIRPDLTGTENGYYEGVAIQLQPFRDMTVYGFYSHKKHTASVYDKYTGDKLTKDELDDNFPIVTSFSFGTGDHKSVSDLEKKNILTRDLYGGKIDYNITEFFRIGFVYSYSKFSIPFDSDVKNDYYYKFRGDKLSQAGFDFDLIFMKGMNLFGEFAISMFPKIDNPVTYDPYKDNISENKISYGFVIGNIIDMKAAKVVLLYRRYQPDFYSFDNGGFQEFDDENEEGFMFGTKIKYNRETKFWGYIDIFRRFWRSYDNDMPPYGFEVYGKIEHKIFKKFKYFLQYKIEEKEISKNPYDTGSEIYWVHNDWRLRNTFEWNPLKTIKFKIYYERAMTYIPAINIKYNSSLILSDIRYKMTSRMKIYVRNLYFDTLYDAGIWEYENDIPEYMASNAYYGKGHRAYIMVSDKISKSFLFTIKFARTHYYNVSSVVTTLDTGEATTSEQTETMLGATSYDFKAQIDYKF